MSKQNWKRGRRGRRRKTLWHFFFPPFSFYFILFLFSSCVFIAIRPPSLNSLGPKIQSKERRKSKQERKTKKEKEKEKKKKQKTKKEPNDFGKRKSFFFSKYTRHVSGLDFTTQKPCHEL